MPGAVLRPRAAADLEEIGDYIAKDDPLAAHRLIQDVLHACELLGSQPLTGRDRSGLVPGVRSFPVGSYVIFYRAISHGADVIRILHGARDVKRL